MLIGRGNRIRVRFEIECGTCAKPVTGRWLTVIEEVYLSTLLSKLIYIHEFMLHISLAVLAMLFFMPNERQLIVVIVSKIYIYSKFASPKLMVSNIWSFPPKCKWCGFCSSFFDVFLKSTDHDHIHTIKTDIRIPSQIKVYINLLNLRRKEIQFHYHYDVKFSFSWNCVSFCPFSFIKMICCCGYLRGLATKKNDIGSISWL